MIELELSIKVLNSILNEDISFKKALKKHISHNNSGQITTISGLVGCELRHHLFFESLLKGTYRDDQKVSAYLALANHFFYKRIQNSDIDEMLSDHFKEANYDELKKLLQSEKSPIELIPFAPNTAEFASIRFNTPLWITKMWKKHYGSGNLYRVLKANNKPNPVYIKLDRNIDLDEFAKRNEDKAIYDSNLELFKLSTKFSDRSFDEYKNNRLITINPVLVEIFNKYHNDLIREFTIYSGSDDSFIKNFIISLDQNIGVNVVVPDLSTRSALLRFIRLRNARNINLFAAHDEISMKCGISHKQEIIYCYPQSTSFNKITLYPDYCLHIKQDELDRIIALQKSTLENCSKFVMNGGLLVYIVDTLSKKESTTIVDNFLSSHNEFSLIDQKQYFPFENEKASLFYAVFKLKGASND